MKLIPLTQGKYAKVDDEDYEELAKYKWGIHSKRDGYVARKNGYPRYNIYMHREIMKPPPGKLVHHVNGDTLDNQKVNLQVVDDSFNSISRNKMNSNNTSGFRGVTLSQGKWMARVMRRGKIHHFGVFDTPEKASEVVEKFLISWH